MHNIYILIISSLFCFIFLILYLIYFIKYKRLIKSYHILQKKTEFNKTFPEIIKILDTAIDNVIEMYHSTEILKKRFITKDSLSTADFMDLDKEIFLSCVKIIPYEELKYYDQVLNNRLPDVLFRLIHKKILIQETNAKVNITRMSNINKNNIK